MKNLKLNLIIISIGVFIVLVAESAFKYKMSGAEILVVLLVLEKWIQIVAYRISTDSHGVKHCSVRAAWNEELKDEELHIECRMVDGQKGAFVVVDAEHEPIADSIAAFLNGKKK